MGRIETALIRHYLKPTVTSDLPGRLRLSFKGYQMLPKEALPYLHYVQDVMTMLPGGARRTGESADWHGAGDV